MKDNMLRWGVLISILLMTTLGITSADTPETLPPPPMPDGVSGAEAVTSNSIYGPMFDTSEDLGGSESLTDFRVLPNLDVIGVGVESNRWFIVRYNADGSRDTTFNGDGIAFTADFTTYPTYTGNTSSDGIRGVSISDFAIDSQGRILISGSGSDTSFGPNSVGMPIIARFTPNGDLDTTFVGDGTGGYPNCVVCQSTPGILVPSVPEAIYSNLTFQFSSSNAVGVDSQGKIILAGEVDNEDITANDAFVYKLNDNGSRDTSWTAGPEPGTGTYTRAGAIPGLVVVNFGGSPVANPNPTEEEEPSELVIDASDNVIVVGGVEPQADGYIQDRFGVFKLNATNGTLSTTFGSSLPVTSSPSQFTPSRAMAGGVWTRFRNDADGDLLERATTVFIDSQGRLVLGGQVASSTGTFDSALLRFTDVNANAVDTTFSVDGHVVEDLPGGDTRDVLVDVVERESTGKLLAAISTDASPILYGAARFNNDGSLDSSFDETVLGAGDGDGFITTALGTNADPRAGIGLFTEEGFLLGGFVDQGQGANADIALIEYLPEIDVTGNGNPILTGDTTPTTTDGTDFGTVRVTTGSQANTFTIANPGRLRLDLTGTERIALSGAHAADFAVTTDPAISVAPDGGTQDFVITFDPSDTGIRTATVTIVSNDPDEDPYTFDIQGQGIPDLTINDVSVVEGDSGTTNLDFTVSLSLPSPQVVSVDYTTSDDSATVADNDYVNISDTLTIAPNTATEVITITVNGDLFVEPDETFFVTLSNEVNAFLLDDTGIGTIENDDSVQVEFNAATGEGNEGDSGTSGVTAPVLNLSGAILRADNPQTIELTLTDGTATTANNDYEQSNSTITLPAGDYTTLSPVGIPVTALGIVGDTVVEEDETLDLALSTPSAGINLGTTLASTYTILNDDVLTVEFDQATGAGNEGDSGTNAIIAPPSLSVSGATLAQAGGVTLALSDGTATLTDDYTQTENIITIPAADYTTPATIDLPAAALGIVGDTVVEPDETVNLALSGSSPFVTLGAQDTSVYTIVNDDVLTVEFGVATAGAPEGDSGTSAVLEPVINISGAVLDTDQTIGINLTDGTATAADNDYTQTTNALLIPSGDYTTLQTISIPDTVLGIVGDIFVEGDETVNLALGNGAAPLVTLGAQDTSVYTIQNDDAVMVEFDTDVASGNEGDSGTSALVGVSLTVSGSVLANDETVDITLNDGTATLADNDYSQTNATVTIPAGDYSTPTTIAIPVEAAGIVGDLNIEPDEDFLLGVANPTGDLMLGTTVDSTYTILNDDSREIDLRGNGISIANGDTTPDTADGTDFGTVERDAGSATQTFTIANTGNVALDLTGTPLVDITGTNAADFTVSVIPTASVNGGETTTFEIIFDPSTLGTRTATVSIPNNDADEDPYTFVVQGEGVQPNRQLIQNGGFDAGRTNWNLFGDYDFQVVNSVMEFWRLNPGWRGAVLFQEIAEFLPAGAPLRINLALANNSNLEKSVVVMLRNPDFSDTITCAVTLPPNSFFQGVTIEDVTTSDWTSAVFSVRVLDQDETPAVRVDNVSVQYLPISGISSYSCNGYDTPESTELVRNGTFSTPTLREWLMFGGYVYTVNGDTLSFYRLAASSQIAAAFQNIAYQLDAGAPLRAQIDIANTGSAPKDVTILVRNDAWTDSMRCRYTIPPNTPSTTVTIEGNTQTVWEQTAFVVRVNNDDGIGAIEIDNASLIYNSSFTFASTTCVPPTFSSDVPDVEEGEKAPTTILPDAGPQPDSDGAAPAPIAPPNPGSIPEIPGF